MNNNGMITSSKKICLTAILCCLSILFLASLFKNISYPLFWADESMTVMHGKRVLEYGYPKVHDGKNVLYDLWHSNPTLGVDEETDAFIGGANWGQYYIAAIGVRLAELSDDLFTKTGIIRSLFALMGLAGIGIFALLGVSFFYGRLSKMGFLVSFVFLELISVPLALHLREARYYPMTVFFAALAVFVYTRHRIHNSKGQWGFIVLLTASLFLLFCTFSPAYFILLAVIFLFESLVFINRLFFRRKGVDDGGLSDSLSRKELFRDYLKTILPLALSLIAVAPLLSFFRVFYIGEEMAKFNTLKSNTDNLHMYLGNLSMIWRYFASYDFVFLAIALKAGLLVCLALRMSNKKRFALDMPKVAFSNFLTLLFVVYFFAIATIPNSLFTRYFISLQPVLALIIVLDLAVLYDFISRGKSAFAVYFKGSLIIIVAGLVFFNISANIEYIKGHVHELAYQYKGPLDYVIPFIKEKYKSTATLVIATNYEETSFMYYLDSKVIVGYVGNNLEEDTRLIPDIIVYRKGVSKRFADLFSEFVGRGRYGHLLFPVADVPPNNIPELNSKSSATRHRFHTLETDDNTLKVDIFLRM